MRSIEIALFPGGIASLQEKGEVSPNPHREWTGLPALGWYGSGRLCLRCAYGEAAGISHFVFPVS